MVDYWQSFAAAFAAAILSFATLPLTPAVFSALLAGLAIWIACIDLERLIIPDLASIAIAALGLVFIVLEMPAGVLVEEFLDALMRAIAAGGLLFVLRFAGRDGARGTTAPLARRAHPGRRSRRQRERRLSRPYVARWPVSGCPSD